MTFNMELSNERGRGVKKIPSRMDWVGSQDEVRVNGEVMLNLVSAREKKANL